MESSPEIREVVDNLLSKLYNQTIKEYGVLIAFVLPLLVLGYQMKNKSKQPQNSSMSKAQRAKLMRADFEKVEQRNRGNAQHSAIDPKEPKMKISEV